MTQVSYAFGIVFIACEIGQRINIAFDECSEMITQFNWYRCPVKIQRMLLVIIPFAEEPIDVDCFGSTTCNRGTFQFVCVIKLTIEL